jgi:hypothetical protein
LSACFVVPARRRSVCILFHHLFVPAEGLDVIADIGTVPTFQPNDNLVAYNKFAQLLGDERAVKTRAKWGKPLKAVVITGSGILLN